MDFLQGIRSFLDQLDISTPPRTGKLVSPAYEALRIPALYVHDLTGTEDADRLLSKPLPIHPLHRYSPICENGTQR